MAVRRAASVIVCAPQPARAAKMAALPPAACAFHSYSVLFMLRSARSGFMASRTVFPGGAVEPCDAAAAGAGDPAAADRVGAIRELFEETGLLLARAAPAPAAAGPARCAVARGATAADRDAVNADAGAFAGVCARLGVAPDVGALEPWARWITPRAEPRRRFDTAFFVAALDETPEVAADGAEGESLSWMCPCQALRAAEDGRVLLAPPQVYILQQMRALRSSDDVLAAARSRPGVEAWQPTIVGGKGGSVVVALPDDPLHHEDDLAVDGAPPRRPVGAHRVVRDASSRTWRVEADGHRSRL